MGFGLIMNINIEDGQEIIIIIDMVAEDGIGVDITMETMVVMEAIEALTVVVMGVEDTVTRA